MSTIDTEKKAPEDRPFILVREDRDLSLSYYFSSYLESATSEQICFGGKHFVGLKLHEPTARSNALWQGWTCITAQYYAAQKEEASEVEEPEVKITIDTEPKKAKRSTRKRK